MRVKGTENTLVTVSENEDLSLDKSKWVRVFVDLAKTMQVDQGGRWGKYCIKHCDEMGPLGCAIAINTAHTAYKTLKREGNFNEDVNTALKELYRVVERQGMQLDAGNLSEVFRVAVTYQVLSKDQYATLGSFLAPKAHFLSNERFVNTAWVLAKEDVHVTPLIDALVGVSRERVKTLTAYDLAVLTWSLGTLKVENKEIFDVIGNRILQLLDRDGRSGSAFKDQDCVMMALGLARAQSKQKQVFSCLAQLLESRVAHLGSHHMASIAWSYGEVGFKEVSLFSKIASRALSIIEVFKPEELANLARGFSIQEISHPQLLHEIARNACRKIRQFNGLGLGMLAGAFESLKIHSSELTEAISNRVVDRSLEIAPHGLVHVCLYFETFGLDRKDVWQRLEDRIFYQVSEAAPADLVALLRVIAQRKTTDTQLMGKFSQTISNRLYRDIRAFSEKDLSVVFRSCASLNIVNRDLIYLGKKAALDQLKDLSWVSLATIFWAVATFRDRDEMFINEMLKEITCQVGEMDSHHLSLVLWAMLHLRFSYPPFTAALHERMKTLAHISVQDLSMIIWCYVCMEVNLDIVQSTLENLMRPEVFNHLPERSLHQLYHVYRYLQLYCGLMRSYPALEQSMLAIQRKGIDGLRECSIMHKEVSSILNELNYRHENEVEMEGFIVDIRLSGRSNIIIEIDGPPHFCADGTRIGEDDLKDKILEKKGMRIFRLNYKEWEKLSIREKRNLLQKTLSGAEIKDNL